MECSAWSLCVSLPRLGRRERAFWLGVAQGLAWRHQEEKKEERAGMQREEMVYHGGKRTQGERVKLEVRKEEGSDGFCQVIEASSTAAAMDALEALIRGYEQFLGVPAHHVLAVLATVMTVPCGHIENVSAMADQSGYDAAQLLARPIVDNDTLRKMVSENDQV